MNYTKALIYLFVILFSCTPFQDENSSEKTTDDNQSTQIQNQALSPAEAWGCKSPINALGLECLIGKYFIRLYYHNTHEFTYASCYKGTNLPKKPPHANIQLKKFKKPPSSFQEAQLTHKNKGIAKSVFNIHFGVYKSFDGRVCYILWITSGYLEICKKKPGGECICFNQCSLTPEELKDWVKEDLKTFVQKFSKFMGIQSVIGLTIWGAAEGLSLVAVNQAIKCFTNSIDSICKYFLNFALQPAGDVSGDFGEPNDDPDEPDDEPDKPLLDDGPPPLNGCECNLPENDANICFDDAFGKPNPQEYKPELTVVGRDEEFLYVFGKDASLFNRAIFWSDPNPDGLENCVSIGQWDGTFMVFKLQPCRTWFAISNENKTIWLSPDSQATRVAEGVGIMPYGNGHNFTLTCGAEPNNFNLLSKKDFIKEESQKKEEKEIPSQPQCPLDAAYGNGSVCLDDTIQEKPLPTTIKPEITVLARRKNTIHLYGAKASFFKWAIFWTTKGNLEVAWVEGKFNNFSMVFEIPKCYNRFACAEKISGTQFLSPNANTTRVEDGVQIVLDGNNYNFAFTCGKPANNLNKFSSGDLKQELEDKCQAPIHLVVSRQNNEIKLEGKDAKTLKTAHFWAWPNTSAPYDLVSWSYGIYDGCVMLYPIPEKQNPQNHWRFVLYYDDKFSNPIGPWYPNLEIGSGIQTTDQGSDLVFEVK